MASPPPRASEGARPSRGTPAPRTQQLTALAVIVTLAHLWLAGRVVPDRLGDGAADLRPRRIEVAFVRELAPAAPAPVVAAPRPRRRAVPPAPAASAPAAARPAPDPPEPVVEAHAEPVPPEPALPTSAPDPAASLAAADAAPGPAIAPLPDIAPGETVVGPVPAAAPAASAPTAFEWPPSTRLSYRLTGNYRGPVEGQAQVEWLRSGTRYQVHMDLSIGPAFSPLISRRVVQRRRDHARGPAAAPLRRRDHAPCCVRRAGWPSCSTPTGCACPTAANFRGRPGCRTAPASSCS